MQRGEHEYEQEGRIQNFNEALHVDKELKRMLEENGIEYHEIPSGEDVSMIIDVLNIHEKLLNAEPVAMGESNENNQN